MAAIGSNALFQAVSLIIFARTLGTVEFAVIVAATAAATVAAEFVGLGSGDLLIRDVSRNPEAHAAAFGRALWLVGLTILPFCLIAAVVAEQWFSSPASLTVLLALVASEIVAIRFAWLGEQIAIAHHAIHTATISRIYASFVRFGAVCIAVFLAGVSTAAQWSIFAVASSLILAAGCMAISIFRFGTPIFGRGPDKASRDGIPFSLLQILRAMQFSLDKFAVASVASTATVGAFGAASRVFQLGLMPAAAVTRMTYPTFFAQGAEGVDAAMHLARRLAPVVFGLGLISSIALVGIAFALPFLLGVEFSEAKFFVLMLAPLPLACAIQNLGGNLLSGSDFQFWRILAMSLGLLFMALAAFAGAWLWGVPGAVGGYVIGHYLYAAVSWLIIAYLWHSARP